MYVNVCVYINKPQTSMYMHEAMIHFEDGFTVAAGELFEIIFWIVSLILMKWCWVLCLETSSGD